MKRFILPFALLLASHSQASLSDAFLDDSSQECIRHLLNTEDTQAYSTHFHNIVTAPPAAVFKPRTPLQLSRFMTLANKHDVKVSVRGGGKSAFGQSLVKDGIVVDLADMQEGHLFREEGVYVGPIGTPMQWFKTISVSPSMTWYQVIELALERKLTVPVAVDDLRLTVGGTLSCAGAIGGSSYLHGSGADNIKSIEVTTMDGGWHGCSKNVEAGLLNSVLGGLGQFGIMTRVEIRLVAAPSLVVKYTVTYDELSHFIEDQKAFSESTHFHHIKGHAAKVDGKWQYVIGVSTFIGLTDQISLEAPIQTPHAVKTETDIMDYWRFVNEVTTFVDALKGAGALANPMPWYNVLMPESSVKTHLAHVLESPYLTGTEPVIVYPMKSEHFNRPFFRRPEGTFWLVGVFYNTGFGSRPDFPVQEVLAKNAAMYKLAKAAGGFRFPVDATPFTPEDWKEHYGETWEKFKALKDKYDPKHLLGTGVGVFK